jgi:aldehyde:ferredoxin oxidoreductase
LYISSTATGWDLSADDYLIIGERIFNLRKAFNVDEGLLPEDQRMNERAVGKPPLQKGPLKGITIDIEGLQKEFFEIVGWENPSGGPSQAKMKELGLASLFATRKSR